MKILFLAHLFPLPLDSGGKIKSYYTLKTLAKEHDVHVVSYARLDAEYRLLDQLRTVCKDVELVRLSRSKLRQASDLLLSLPRGRSFIISRDFRREMQTAVRRAVAAFEPDVIHIDHLQMAQFVDFRRPCRTVLDHHNVESAIIKRTAETDASLPKRLYAALEWPRLRSYELNVCRRCSLVLTVSDEDGNALRELEPSLDNLRTVPIGVDTDYFQPLDRNPGSLNLLFVGTMYWPPNVDAVLHFYRDIFPIIRKRFPDSTLTIAGQRPTSAIRALSRDPAVNVTGYVDDIRDVARECAVMIVPLRAGSGVRVKILNALAMEIPVVSTSVGAEGLDVSDGEHLLIADTAQEFAEAVAKLFQNAQLARSLGENGRKLVCAKYSWDAVGERLLSVYRSNLENRRSGP
jgi:sugar transferase (PEP-CTERM/EpsH1 system associated)